MDAKFISKSLTASWNWKGNEDFAINAFIKRFESDFITITKAGYMHEIEIKVDRSDFKADFAKVLRRYNHKIKDYEESDKHEMIKSGLYGLKTFSFATPVGLLHPAAIPDYCGFYEVMESGFVNTVKKPPVLDNPRKMDEKETQKLHNFYKWRWRNLYYEKVGE